MKKAEEIVERHLTAKGCKCDVMDKTKQYEACLNAVNEALDYARSSLPLKDKETLPFEVWLHKQDVLTTKYNTYINGYQLKEGESLHTIYYKDLLNL